jgi:drug/metabolite transporter (DMT)-like permease
MGDDHRPILPPMLAMALSILAVSTASIFIRHAQEEAPSLVIATYRMTLASLALWPFALARSRATLRTLTKRQLTLALAAGVFLAAHFATWIASLEYTTVASSVVLVSLAPLFVALLSPFVLREPLSRWVWLGLGLSLAGSVIVGLSDACEWQAGLHCPPLSEFVGGKAFLGNLLAVLGAVTVAGYFMIGRMLRHHLPLLPYISLAYGSAAIVLLAATLLSGHPLVGYPKHTYLWLILLALIPQLFAHSTYNWALRYLPAAIVTIALLGEPVGATLLAYILLGERPGRLMLVGAILILAGIAIASWRRGAADDRPPMSAQIG